MADIGRNAHEWAKGNVVTATKLNHIETDLTNAISYINANFDTTNDLLTVKKPTTIIENLTVNGSVILGSTVNNVTTVTTIRALCVDSFENIPTITNANANQHKIEVDNGKLYANIATATSNLLGIIKVGSNLNINDGTLNVPLATNNSFGVIKVGANLAINDGVLSGAYVGGSNIQISGNSISATYSAGTNIQISNTGVISATDTTYSAGSNIQIDNNGKINATYSAGTNIQINNGVISATNTTYSIATTDAAGLMSSADRDKLDSINITSSITQQTDGDYIPTINAINSYCEHFMGKPANDSPSLADGTYILKLTVQTTDGERTATYSWVAEGGE